MAGRASYADAGVAGRALIQRAMAASPPLGTRELRVVAGLVSLVSLYSRVSERVYIPQLAAAAYGVDPPAEWQLRKVRSTLRALEARGGILTLEKTSGRSGYYIDLGGPTTGPSGTVSDGPTTGPSMVPPQDHAEPHDRTIDGPTAGPLDGPTAGPRPRSIREGSPEEPFEEYSEGGDVAALAHRLAAIATLDAPAEDLHDFAVMLTDSDLGAATLDQALDTAGQTRPRTLSDLHDALVQAVVDATEDDDMFHTNTDSDRAFLLTGSPLGLAIARACRGPLRRSAREAAALGEYLQHRLPDSVLDDVIAELELHRDALTRPKFALRIVRRVAEEHDHDLERVDVDRLVAL